MPDATPPDPAGAPLIGTFALVPLVVDAVDVPVLAAGGVMDGRGLAAALALGAQGAQMGTRFLFAAEANVAEPYRQRLLAARDVDTFVTDAVTGRPARWVRNRVTEGLEGAGGHLGWGAQRIDHPPLQRWGTGWSQQFAHGGQNFRIHLTRGQKAGH